MLSKCTWVLAQASTELCQDMAIFTQGYASRNKDKDKGRDEWF